MASVIYLIPTFEFQEIVKASKTFTEILKKCDLENKGGNINTVKRRIEKEKLDSSHIVRGLGHNKGKFFEHKRISLQQAMDRFFIKDGKSQRGCLIKLIKRYNLLDNKCHECGIRDIWNSKKLSLQLDHANGDGNDNRLENLRFLCPNCHSQTSTFAGRKLRVKYSCNKCKKSTKGFSDICSECSHFERRKVEWPSKENLEKDLENNTMLSVGKKYGVSDNTVRKWMKHYNIDT
jgi:Zn finger protein HypA/HybF involved in hydrogenase expression